MVSCSNPIDSLFNKGDIQESKNEVIKKTEKRSIEPYFMTSSKKQKVSAWVYGESNKNPLKIKEKAVIVNDDIEVENPEEKDDEQESTVEIPSQTPQGQVNNVEPQIQDNIVPQQSNSNNTFTPSPDYDMQNIIPGPDDAGNPMDPEANPNDIVADPYE